MPELPPNTNTSSPLTPSAKPTITELKKQLADAEAALAATKAKAAAPRPSTDEPRPMMGLKSIMELTGKSENAIMDGAAKGTFVRPVKMGRSIRWFCDEFALYQELAAAERDVKWLRAQLERVEQETRCVAERERAIRRYRP
jgi:predicted DNA-binding transcriptional regulator AlpA